MSRLNGLIVEASSGAHGEKSSAEESLIERDGQTGRGAFQMC